MRPLDALLPLPSRLLLCGSPWWGKRLCRGLGGGVLGRRGRGPCCVTCVVSAGAPALAPALGGGFVLNVGPKALARRAK